MFRGDLFVENANLVIALEGVKNHLYDYFRVLFAENFLHFYSEEEARNSDHALITQFLRDEIKEIQWVRQYHYFKATALSDPDKLLDAVASQEVAGRDFFRQFYFREMGYRYVRISTFLWSALTSEGKERQFVDALLKSGS